MRRLAFLLVFLAAGVGAHTAAADVQVHAGVDRTQLAVGETADLSVEIEGAQDAEAPTLGAVDGLSVRYVGPASQLSIVNGRTSASITHHFSVTATKAGTFTIGPIVLDYGGKRYDAGTVTIRAGAGAPPDGAAAGGGGRGAPGGDQLRLVLTSPRTRAYLHEHVPATLTLTIGAVQVSEVHYPAIAGDGFALEPLREPVQRREGTVQIVEFRTTLTPLRAGDLTLGPATLELSVPVRGGRDPFFDRFLGGDPFGARRPVTLQSEPLHLEVLPLPDAGKPADFSGAVGRFTLRVDAAPRALKAGDPVTITTTIEGDGNLDGIRPPLLAESDALKTYPVQPMPQPSSGAATAGSRARAVFEQVVIPQRAGTLTLPAPRFSSFDPDAAAYRTLTAAAITLAVEPSTQGAPQAPVGAPAAIPARAPAPETLGHDIVFIKDTPGELRPIGSRRYRSPTFWALQLVPLAVWAAVVLYDRRRRQLRADPRLARFSTAGRSARRAIAAAEATLQSGDRAGFYDALAHTMREYLSAKLDLPPGAITADSVAERARQRGVPAPIAAELGTLFAAWEHARFAPRGEIDGDMRQALTRAESLLRTLERTRRRGTAAAAVVVLVATSLVAAAAPRALRATDALRAGSAGDTAPSTERGAPARGDAPHTIFFRANTLYGEERYAEAAAEYARILAAGLESGPLYFNLGNAYFRAGDVGHAVLAYERARRLMPSDPDLRANLRFARDGTPPDEPSLVARVLFPLASRAASDTLLLAASALYVALVALAIVRRLAPAIERGAARAALTVAMLLLVVAASAVDRLLAIDLPAHAIVVAPQGGIVRFEPSATGTAHFTVKTGAMLRILSSRDQWAQVTRSDGTRGWIAADTIAPL
jgi:tetratricopeptide (TPR) repeat protein